jgi:hypothetical protein
MPDFIRMRGQPISYLRLFLCFLLLLLPLFLLFLDFFEERDELRLLAGVADLDLAFPGPSWLNPHFSP